MRVHVVDPSAYTPPYDDALCRALAAAGAEVELFTSRFAYQELAAAEGYLRRDFFYRLTPGVRGSRLRMLAKLAQHGPDMLRYRSAARTAEVVHFQWLTVQHLDGRLLAHFRSPVETRRPLVLTAHDILPREPRRGQRAAQRRLYEHFDAIVVHSAHGRERLIEELGVEAGRVHVIRHGVLRPWESAPGRGAEREPSLPDELLGIEGPVALMFGLLRPYKGLDVLLDAWRRAAPALPAGAELWVVGMPRMDVSALRAAAPASVRFLLRFVSDAEMLALMRRASLVVLPYREIEDSGVAFTALGAGVPLLLSDVGGFPELAATGAARTVRAGDRSALGEALGELLADPEALAAMAASARAAAAGEYAWDGIARQTLSLYRALRAGESGR